MPSSTVAWLCPRPTMACLATRRVTGKKPAEKGTVNANKPLVANTRQVCQKCKSILSPSAAPSVTLVYSSTELSPPVCSITDLPPPVYITTGLSHTGYSTTGLSPIMQWTTVTDTGWCATKWDTGRHVTTPGRSDAQTLQPPFSCL